MSDISTEELRKEIIAILKTADLSVVSAKKVREQIEKKLKCSLQNRKKEFDSIVMDFINQQHEGASQDDDEDDDDDDDDDDGGNGQVNGDNSESSSGSSDDSIKQQQQQKSKSKRPPPTQRKTAATKKKRKSVNANDSGSESDGDSDSDYEMPKKKKKKAGGGGGGGSAASGRKSTGFTRSYNLSPELSALMGADSLPRHEVVKKVWAIIKERNLYDPKNKQYAICDDELLKVMQVKRFRTFGMLKHLKPHFLN